jgi:hypothetical protein
MLAETIFQKFFPDREYEIESGVDSDKVFSPGFEVSHNRKSQTLLATRPGDQYGRRYLLNLKGDEIDVLRELIDDTVIKQDLLDYINKEND